MTKEIRKIKEGAGESFQHYVGYSSHYIHTIRNVHGRLHSKKIYIMQCIKSYKLTVVKETSFDGGLDGVMSFPFYPYIFRHECYTHIWREYTTNKNICTSGHMTLRVI